MRPSATQSLRTSSKSLLENGLVVLERDMEWQILAFVVAPAGSEIDPAVAQKIQRCPLLCDPDRVVQRQHGHGRREADAVGASRDVREDQIGGGENPERVEMVLADPGRMHADLLGVERFRGDVLDELVSRALVVLIVIIAQGEISKIHFRLLRQSACPRPGPF